MDAAARREQIRRTLSQASVPVSAASLARSLGVSRQVIVGDVALLRAGGVRISATPRGYLLGPEERGILRTVACRHTAGEMEAELTAVVDNGCTVLDVIVEHPVYGQLTGALGLTSRYDIRQFILRSNSAQPLSLLTEGVHLHTLSCPDEASVQRVRVELARAGFLLDA